jgi:hypothetical protein
LLGERRKVMTHKKVIAEGRAPDLLEQLIRDLVEVEIVLDHGHRFFGVADIHFGVELKPT